MRTEQLKLTAPSMQPFVVIMQSMVKQKAWQRGIPAETSGQSHNDSASPSATASGWGDGLVDNAVVDHMVAMGFTRDGASLAAMKTGNTGKVYCMFVNPNS